MKKIILSSVFAMFGLVLFAQVPAQTGAPASEPAKTSGAIMTFEQSEIDQCLSMKNDILYVAYVDDIVFAGLKE